MDEIIEIYDEFNNFLNLKKEKSEAHKYGYYHRSVHIWIYNSNGEILLQKRSKDKLIYPYLKKYTYYKMKDMGFLTNYEKSFSSIRGSGVWKNGKHYYLFVDLHKGENVQESINYKDKLLSPALMQWQTQNKTTPSSEIGKDLIDNVSRNIKLHMFLRKTKQIGNQKLNYIYIGEVEAISYDGEKPITIQMRLVDTLPKHIYDDLTFVKNVE